MCGVPHAFVEIKKFVYLAAAFMTGHIFYLPNPVSERAKDREIGRVLSFYST